MSEPRQQRSEYGAAVAEASAGVGDHGVQDEADGDPDQDPAQADMSTLSTRQGSQGS